VALAARRVTWESMTIHNSPFTISHSPALTPGPSPSRGVCGWGLLVGPGEGRVSMALLTGLGVVGSMWGVGQSPLLLDALRTTHYALRTTSIYEQLKCMYIYANNR